MKYQGKEVRFCQIVLRLGTLLRKFFAANKKISFDTTQMAVILSLVA